MAKKDIPGDAFDRGERPGAQIPLKNCPIPGQDSKNKRSGGGNTSNIQPGDGFDRGGFVSNPPMASGDQDDGVDSRVGGERPWPGVGSGYFKSGRND